jgi:electron transport complex protein RnfB
MTESVNVMALLLSSLIFLAVMALVFGIGLAFTARKFYVKTDPRVEKVSEALAHAHCGACGFAGCEQYADAVVNNPDIAANLCTAGGKQCTDLIAELTGKLAVERESSFARIMCQGSIDKAKTKFMYEGFKDCRAAVFAGGGEKACPWRLS